MDLIDFSAVIYFMFELAFQISLMWFLYRIVKQNDVMINICKKENESLIFVIERVMKRMDFRILELEKQNGDKTNV